VTIDLARARRDAPATAEVPHFNNAGAALMPTPVLEAQLRCYNSEEVARFAAAIAALA